MVLFSPLVKSFKPWRAEARAEASPIKLEKGSEIVEANTIIAEMLRISCLDYENTMEVSMCMLYIPLL